MTPEEMEGLVMRSLEEGVPPGVVSRVFDLDPELVKEAQSAVRVKHYDTDDEGDLMDILKWEAIGKARQIIATGSAAEQKAILGTVLGKHYAISARRTPESVRNSQGAVLDLLEGMRSGGPKVDAPPSKFIARRGDNADTG